jgi:SAM-dependent methyltransferase
MHGVPCAEAIIRISSLDSGACRGTTLLLVRTSKEGISGTMEFADRVKREKESYDSGDVLGESRRLQARFHHVFSSPNAQRAEQYLDATLETSIKAKDLLDYGCSNGWMVERYVEFGAGSITGIDISETGIQQAIKNYGHLASFHVGDAHNMPFPDKSFDVVAGRSILHHLDFDRALHEITRVLRPGGRAIFVEPLGDNPAGKLIRCLTPKARTPDEAPLSRGQIRFADKLLGNQEHRFFNLVSVPVAMATSLTRMKPDNLLTRAADAIDLGLAVSPMKYWMRQVVLVWQKLQ